MMLALLINPSDIITLLLFTNMLIEMDRNPLEMDSLKNDLVCTCSKCNNGINVETKIELTWNTVPYHIQDLCCNILLQFMRKTMAIHSRYNDRHLRMMLALVIDLGIS